MPHMKDDINRDVTNLNPAFVQLFNLFQFAAPHKREADGGAEVDERGASGAAREHVPQPQSQPLLGDGAR